MNPKLQVVPAPTRTFLGVINRFFFYSVNWRILRYDAYLSEPIFMRNQHWQNDLGVTNVKWDESSLLILRLREINSGTEMLIIGRIFATLIFPDGSLGNSTTRISTPIKDRMFWCNHSPVNLRGGTSLLRESKSVHFEGLSSEVLLNP